MILSSGRKICCFAARDFSRNFTKMVITDDGSTIVALHPKKKFPYEYSKPLPPPPAENPGILRMDNVEKVKGAFGQMPMEFVRHELAKRTQSTKHQWFPRARDRKAKKTPMDRQYL